MFWLNFLAAIGLTAIWFGFGYIIWLLLNYICNKLEEHRDKLEGHRERINQIDQNTKDIKEIQKKLNIPR